MGNVIGNASIGRDHSNSIIDGMRQRQVDAIVRHVYALNITGSKLWSMTHSIRPNELSDLKIGETKNFGVGRLATVCQTLGMEQVFRCYRPLESYKHLKTKDQRIHRLFSELYRVYDLSQETMVDIGARSYPTTRAVVDQVGVLSLQLVENISREPYFWHREVFAVSAIYLSAEQLLKRMKTRTWRIDQLLFQLGTTAELMEGIADDLLAKDAEAA
ncbi:MULTISPECIES: hypothetical protein [unclassified Ensifer]|uniref:hypothetical protein n=1 Tax=unclassified Ensifer TaxID=2633371 RepID=UPI0008131F4F|nr:MULTISPECIES: hypothetical protein [unclassified Ensifer]OCP07994.1 hypothetical protein BC362_10310 [Ensifer sp. LC14]OCP10896.1 hypothetical protein BC374_17655 [Ensifer sp. LC13]OCP11558.1 hypothetical protein BBX50_18200 [Ensifer sp. LC11]OCP33377.1 hypothetical protein BC364_17090 [Ensifer sp. LC499]